MKKGRCVHNVVCLSVIIASVLSIFSCKEDTEKEVQFIEGFYKSLQESRKNGTTEEVLRTNCNDNVLQVLTNYYDDDCDHDDCFADWIFEDSPIHEKGKLLQRTIKRTGSMEYSVENQYQSHSHIVSIKLDKPSKNQYMICGLKVVQE